MIISLLELGLSVLWPNILHVKQHQSLTHFTYIYIYIYIYIYTSREAIIVISVFQGKFNVEFTRQAVNFSWIAWLNKNTRKRKFVFILSARPRKLFQSQLSELSLRQWIGSTVSLTHLNLRQLYLYLVLVFTFVFKLLKQATQFLKVNSGISLNLQAIHL